MGVVRILMVGLVLGYVLYFYVMLIGGVGLLFVNLGFF